MLKYAAAAKNNTSNLTGCLMDVPHTVARHQVNTTTRSSFFAVYKLSANKGHDYTKVNIDSVTNAYLRHRHSNAMHQVWRVSCWVSAVALAGFDWLALAVRSPLASEMNEQQENRIILSQCHTQYCTHIHAYTMLPTHPHASRSVLNTIQLQLSWQAGPDDTRLGEAQTKQDWARRCDYRHALNTSELSQRSIRKLKPTCLMSPARPCILGWKRWWWFWGLCWAHGPDRKDGGWPIAPRPRPLLPPLKCPGNSPRRMPRPTMAPRGGLDWWGLRGSLSPSRIMKSSTCILGALLVFCLRRRNISDRFSFCVSMRPRPRSGTAAGDTEDRTSQE